MGFWARLEAVRTSAARVLDGAAREPLPAPPEPPTAVALAARLGLDAVALDFLWYATGWAVDPLLGPYTAALAPEPQRGATLVGFARISVHPPADVRAFAAALLAGTHALVRHHLIEPRGLPTTTLSGWVVPTRTIAALRGEPTLDPALAELGGIVAAPSRPHLDAAQEVVAETIAAALASAEPLALVLQGRRGLGRRSLVAIAAARVGKTPLVIDLGRMSPSADADADVFAACTREMALGGVVPVLLGADELPSDDVSPRRRRLRRFIERCPGAVVLIVQGGAAAPELSRATLTVRIDPPAAPTRRDLWRDALGGEPPAAALGPLALRYRLGAGDIGHAATVAGVISSRRGAALTEADLVAGIRATAHESLATVATRLTPRHGWDDLIVSDDVASQLRMLIARGQHSFQVLHEWGFERLVPSSGMTALFSGPPGTGKTMAAGIMARALGLELYRIDLSAVMSKWIGETEKALGRVFDAADGGHALLLFDEADSLFAKRTEVRGATERYANSEVNFLLQRIESFHGVALLTTNMDTSLDPAFRRRITAHIQFPHPDEDERLALWQRLLPAAAPRAPGLDLRRLAVAYTDFTGGHIRNAVVTAAYLAAEAGEPIGMAHLDAAARAEAKALGRVLST